MGRADLSNAEWEWLRPLLPPTGQRGGRWRDHRQVINGIIWRTRTGAPWRDLPERYGPWQTCYKRFARWEIDETWARIEQLVQRDADACGELDWRVQVDTSVVRAHQHAAGARKGGWPQRPRLPSKGWAAPGAACQPRSRW
jgi:transposase